MFNNSYIYNKQFDKILIIGDIHGDLKRLKNILINDNIINNNLQWIAYNTIVIQLGDQIDSLNRNEHINNWEIISDVEVINFTNILSNLALTKNSFFISINGNHELMNILGNFSYVSNNSKYLNRLNSFKKNGIYSNILANRPLVVKVNDLIFCHAGITKKHLDLLDKYNKDIFYINEIWKKFVLLNIVDVKDKELFDNIILDNDGIVWTRQQQSKEDVTYILNKLKCNFIFIGHNTVDTISLHNNTWYIDNGISRAYGKEKYQYLKIVGNEISIVQL